jgi:hypothetical protein
MPVFKLIDSRYRYTPGLKTPDSNGSIKNTIKMENTLAYDAPTTPKISIR